VVELEQTAQPALSWFCLDATAVDDVDFSAAAALREVFKFLKEKNVRLVLSGVDEEIRKDLDVSGITELIGNDSFFETIPDVVAAYRSVNQTNKS
jgi:sulfate permease, SulP family